MTLKKTLTYPTGGQAIGFLLAAAAFLLQSCGTANGSGEAAAEERPPDVTDSPAVATQEGPGRGMAWIILGTDTVKAEVAATPEARRQGLMNREELPEGSGMLFVFPDEGMRSFWMSNTYIPLDIAFLDASSRVVDIKQMEPEDTSLTESDRPAMFALEVIQGWFEAHGIGVGTQAEIVFGPQ